jgi:hypothetical protein
MIYLLMIFVGVSGYYTLSYGITILKEDKNLLGGIATITLAILSTISTIYFIFANQI